MLKYGRIGNLTLAHMAILTNPSANSRRLLQAAKPLYFDCL